MFQKIFIFSLLQAYRFSQLPEMVMGSPPPPVPPRTGPVAVASLRRYLSVVLFQAWSLKPTINKSWGKPCRGTYKALKKIHS